MKKQKAQGVTLIEVLIVIAIISLLLQLALPAVEMARESARQTECKNNVRQLALGCTLHAGTHGHFPTGGWNANWMGDPNRGFSKKQPGGWGYNVLPFVEEQELHDLGMNLPEAERRKVAAQVYGTSVPVHACPSRRLARSQPFGRNYGIKNADVDELKRLNKAGRSDYAGNIGTVLPRGQFWLGPGSYEEGDRWENGKDPHTSWIASKRNGVIYQRSEVKPAMITDGLSKTILLGEKYMPIYAKGIKTQADDQSLYVGFSFDNNRVGEKGYPPVRDQVPKDRRGENRTMLWRFGSAHPTGFHMACCDGSVHQIAYDINPKIFAALCSRNGGDKAELGD